MGILNFIEFKQTLFYVKKIISRRHIGFRRKYSKLDNNLNSWEVDINQRCCDIEELFDRFMNLSSISNEEIKINSEKLIKLANDNFENIYNVLKKYKNRVK